MIDPPRQSNLPAHIADAISGIPGAMIPNCVKALDRLVGAAVDIPVAWLAQKKAQIDAQTKAFTLVEMAVANAAADAAQADTDTVRNAVGTLVRKAYRKQVNREAVASSALEDLRVSGQPDDQNPAPSTDPVDLDDDWINVFERYAEDASTPRMQNLWGRVLAGEIRKPGRYSLRTLRFLSEFSQNDGVTFVEFCTSAFGDAAPSALVRPADKKDIRDLIFLESCGLIQGASGIGLSITLNFDSGGHAFLREGHLAVLLLGTPNESFSYDVCVLTPLGQEVAGLIPGRDARAAARRVAAAIRSPAIKSAFLASVSGPERRINLMEILWQPGLDHPLDVTGPQPE